MTIEIRGIEELSQKLERLNKLPKVRAAMRAVALFLKGKEAKYPAQKQLTRAEVYGESFQSDTQRRFFFWGLANGVIDTPYHRGESASSEALGRSWTVSEQDGGLTQIIGNDTSYGPLVMGEEQTLFMAALGWGRSEQIVAENEDMVVYKLNLALVEEME